MEINGRNFVFVLQKIVCVLVFVGWLYLLLDGVLPYIGLAQNSLYCPGWCFICLFVF